MIETPFPPFDPNGAPDPRGPRLREIPLRMIVPNLITVLAICAGLTGVRLAFEGRFEMAIIMVLIAAFLDGVDGRVARMLKATSRFGVEMDSLADAINFGVVPALVLYVYTLRDIHSFGWIAVLLFAISLVLRLARFNAMLAGPDAKGWRSKFFVGVPAPAAAFLVLLPVYVGFLGIERGPVFSGFSAAYAIVIALLVVSRLPIYSGKGVSFAVRRDLVMPLMLLVVLYVLLLASFMWETLALTAIAFFVSIPFSARSYFRQELEEKQARDIARAGVENGVGDNPTA
jgi:CDP-diacylglycerol--serine O-phosphatidyltransferase